MRIQLQEADILGATPVFCDICDQQISILANRRYCKICNKDYCLSCNSCAAKYHPLVEYPGFPRFSGSREELVEKIEACLLSNEDIFSADRLRYICEIVKIPDASSLFFARETLEGRTRKASGLIWALNHGEAYLRDWLSLRDMGRYVDYFHRRAFAGRLPNRNSYTFSQGAHESLRWRGRPMLRTAWDLALATLMIQEIKPATIIELGTASGGSAVFFADMQLINRIPANVMSVDKFLNVEEFTGVKFLQGDMGFIEECLPFDFLKKQPHPWLVIEDTHYNVGGIMRYLHKHFESGDYICIEDLNAENELVDFLPLFPQAYAVDTRYTDFFGHNATCSADQIFRRM